METWLTLARWGIVTAWTLLVVFGGDVAVRWVFHQAGGRDATPAEPSPDRPVRLGPTEDAAAVAAGADLGESGPLSGTPPGPVAVLPPPIEAAAAQLRGGRVIGWLERLGVVVTLLSGFPAGIAAIVAVKGLARYPDLKGSDGTAERFIIGTFTSLLLGAAGAGAAHWCLSQLP